MRTRTPSRWERLSDQLIPPWQGEFKDGILNRVGVLVRAEMNSTRFEGEWVNGLLEGEVKDHSFAQGWLEGYYKDGVQHGFFREFGARQEKTGMN